MSAYCASLSLIVRLRIVGRDVSDKKGKFEYDVVKKVAYLIGSQCILRIGIYRNMLKTLFALCLAVLVTGTNAWAETPEEWVTLGARVHGGFGSFIPVGIRIGLDAIERLTGRAGAS
jgi:hypothetical protein